MTIFECNESKWQLFPNHLNVLVKLFVSIDFIKSTQSAILIISVRIRNETNNEYIAMAIERVSKDFLA